MTEYVLPPMMSWHEFLRAAQRPETVPGGSGRGASAEWAGATWDEAMRLAVDGWPLALREARVSVGDLRERAGLRSVTTLEPTWDVTGSEVDVGAYLAGVPECMVDAVPRRTSTRGRVVSFLIPAGYSFETPHDEIRNRGLALATLCSAIIDAGHSVEIWSGDTGMTGPDFDRRYSAVARVISSGEPFDVGRLIFAVAHPAMCRRLWFSVWDACDEELSLTLRETKYGRPPFTCEPTDLPPEVTDPYVFPYLRPGDPQWSDLDTALDWCHTMFADLGLLEA
ncbi:DUF7192 family protein [Amycolatopsis sp.]|uniref:DUF7192 family protein n=1 Tax=Amycolatopsis sp. TaxID=37632 RepID=UPI002BC23CB3|nr:hypothetical protein [Amycolatopsis sp.]HVV08886.1 hypothetical protein [Amycolatopsis sp.]